MWARRRRLWRLQREVGQGVFPRVAGGKRKISVKTAEDAVRLAQYQVHSHEYYRTKAADTPNAKVQGKILRALQMKGLLSKRHLQQLTNAHRDGTELWNRALTGLIQDGRIEIGRA